MEGSSVGDGMKNRVSKFPIGMRVLIVDNDLVCLKLLEAQLQQCGYKVTSAQHAHIALQLLRQDKNDIELVMTDIRIPDIDGFKLLEVICLEMDLPVVMISADSSEATFRRSIMYGACDFLAKPVCIEELKFIWKHVVQTKVESFKKCILENHDVAPLARAEDESSHTSAKKHRDRRQGNEKENEANNCSVVEGPKRKKARVMWSSEMHSKFIDAVNQVGLDRVVPKIILDRMNIPWLTRENVASHLQKYREALKKHSVDLTINPLPSYLASLNEGEICEGITTSVNPNYNPANPHGLNLQFPSAAYPCNQNSFQQQYRPVSQEDQQKLSQFRFGSNPFASDRYGSYPLASDISKPLSIYKDLVVDRSSALILNKRKGYTGNLPEMGNSSQTFQPNVNQDSGYVGISSRIFQSDVNQNNSYVGNSSETFQPDVNQHNYYVGISSQPVQPGVLQNIGYMGNSSQTFQPGVHQNNVGNSSQTFQPAPHQYNSHVRNSSQAFQPNLSQQSSQIVQPDVNWYNGYVVNSSQRLYSDVNQNNSRMGNPSQTFWPSDTDPMPTLSPQGLMNEDTLNYLREDNSISQQGDQEERLLAAPDKVTLGEKQEFLDCTGPDPEWVTLLDENVLNILTRNEENFDGTNPLATLVRPGQHSAMENMPNWSKCDDVDSPSTHA